MGDRLFLMPDASDESSLDGGGVLLVRTTDTTPGAGREPINRVTLVSLDQPLPKEARLPWIRPPNVSYGRKQNFGSVLPAGHYRIDKLRAFYGDGQFARVRDYFAGAELGSFEIRSGQVTDLGELIAYTRPDGSDYGFAVTRAPSQKSSIDLFLKNASYLAAKISNLDEPIGWQEDHDPDRHVRGYEMAVRRQSVGGDPWVDSVTGSILFPLQLGVILTRHAAGKWEFDQLPYAEAVRQVVRFDDTMIATTDEENIYVKTIREPRWAQSPPPPGPGLLAFVGPDSSAGVVAIRMTDTVISIWVAAKLGGEWTRVHSIEEYSDLTSSKYYPSIGFVSAINETSFVLSSGTLLVKINKNLHRVDLEKGSHEKTVIQGELPLRSRNGILSSASRWSFSRQVLSFDGGVSWKLVAGYLDDRRDLSRKLKPREKGLDRSAALLTVRPIFLNDRHGFGIHVQTKTTTEPFLVETLSGGERWVAKPEAAVLPNGCDDLVSANATELLLACPMSGEYYNSSDAGVSWQLDRPASGN